MTFDESDLASIFIRYSKWIAEGEPPYFYSTKDRKAQHYYDSYHEHITRITDHMYEFQVQLSDSPNGDEWVRGHFEMGPSGLKIIEKRYYMS